MHNAQVTHTHNRVCLIREYTPIHSDYNTLLMHKWFGNETESIKSQLHCKLSQTCIIYSIYRYRYQIKTQFESGMFIRTSNILKHAHNWFCQVWYKFHVLTSNFSSNDNDTLWVYVINFGFYLRVCLCAFFFFFLHFIVAMLWCIEPSTIGS